MLLRALFAQARRTAASGTVVDTATEKLRACLSRRALSTGARAEKASASSSSMPVCDADDEDSSSSSSSDLDDFRAMLSDFASREIAPLAEEIDRTNTAPMDLWTKMGEFGLHGITVPPEHGGLGLGYLEHVIAMEELSRASGAVALSYGAHSNLCVSQLSRNATEEQKRRFLPKLLTGEHVGALAMSEPNAGSDVVSMRTKATKVDGGFLLDGTKMWITNGTVADVVIVYAKTDPSAGSKGVTAFVVDRANTPRETFSAHQKLDKLGMRGSDTCELVFDRCLVPDENVLGEVGKGVYVLFSGLDYERLVLSGGPLGLARAALDVAVPYAAQRKQFGQRIGDFQLVAAKLADGWTRTQAARALVYSAASKADAKTTTKKKNSSSSPLSVSGGWSSKGERARECAAAILFSAETATQVALDALQVLGGNGYINEYPTGRILRDAKLYEIGAGTSEIRRLVIGRELMREVAE